MSSLCVLTVHPSSRFLFSRDRSVIKGRITGMDFSNKDMPQLMVETKSKKTEALQLSQISFVQFDKPFPEVQPPPGAVRVTVPAYQQWTDTSVEVKKGYRMLFSVSPDNIVTCGPNSIDSNADGANPFWYGGSRPIPDVKECTLIGRVGHKGTPFKIGLNTTPNLVQEDGRLQLGINDHDFRDNSGEFLVFIKVESSEQFQPGSSRMSQSNVTVPATVPWTVTNIPVKKGQRLLFDVSPDNTINCDRRPNASNADD